MAGKAGIKVKDKSRFRMFLGKMDCPRCKKRGGHNLRVNWDYPLELPPLIKAECRECRHTILMEPDRILDLFALLENEFYQIALSIIERN